MLRLGQVFGHLSNKKGKDMEALAVNAFNCAKDLPFWLMKVEHAPSKLDRRGVDLIITSDVGRIYIQIKSSNGGAAKFVRQQKEGRYDRRIGVVALLIDDSDYVVRQKIIAIAACLRERSLKIRNRILNHRNNL